MATTTDAPRQTLFLRNATGLVKAWSTFDAFLYAFWSVNLVTLGLYGMSFVYAIPDGQLLGAVLLTGVLDPERGHAPIRPVLRAAGLYAGVDRCGHLLRQPVGDLRQLPDRARLRQLGHHPGHGGLRKDPAVLLLAGDGGPGRHARAPALLDPPGVHRRLQSGGCFALRRFGERLSGHHRGGG